MIPGLRMVKSGAAIVKVEWVLCLLFCTTVTTVLTASCPSLKSKTVLVSCVSKGSPFNCTEQPSPPGTVATFRCKHLHQFLFGYLPPTGYESRCGDDGEWSVQPFRCVPVCGRPTGKPTAFVRDGEKVSSAADYPWHVTIYDVTLDMRQICGGSLITAKFFVSAAHCFHDNVAKPLPPERYVAAFARTKRDVTIDEPNVQYRQLAKIHMKDYGAKKLQYANDISLVELDNEVDVTAWTLPVCVDWGLELSDLRHGQEGTVVGFGYTADVASDELRFAKLPFIRGEECRKQVTDKLAIFSHLPDKFCVGFVNSTSVAPGDSGGGMAFPSDDRIWYLRGVVSVGSSLETTVSYFTNVTAFVPWISSVIQEGEVTGRRCGVDVTESSVVDGAKVGRKDFPWEVEVYYKRASNRNFERLWSAVLVQPNLAITTVLQEVRPGRQIDMSEYPTPWLRVVSRRNTNSFDISDAANVSEVVRAFYPDDVFINSALVYNFILLELKQPINVMPVCLDWAGAALIQNRQIGTTIQEAPGSNAPVWRRYPLVGPARCSAMLEFASENQNICVESAGAEEPPLHQSLLVNVDNTWFLRGVMSAFRERSATGYTIQYTDMGDPGVIKWLAKTRDSLGKPTCGNINLCEPLSAGMALPGHFPWNVAVVVDEGGKSVVRGSGLLIQANAVLTDVAHIMNETGVNTKQGLPFVSPESISILWTDDEGTAMRSGVVRLEVRDGPPGGIRYVVALLEVDPKESIYATPVCLDLSGTMLEQLGPGHLGVVEAWRRWAPANHTLVASEYRGRTDCYARLQETSRPPEYTARTQFCTSADREIVGTVSSSEPSRCRAVANQTILFSTLGIIHKVRP
ncbi:uncharacterized protein LOC113217967 [Frankliniella occidentalis]|uniref:Uncharacterized protein LOC113217967 n=1 Tax=Frankliniella occidentalis TaxID=133901 RepID=A0A9C6TX50_FRAOC|nr:uncharacterized protein LOC113217967 [Frankliniella occidentalis]